MTPLDDELRSVLHTRAEGLPAAPDPLAGVVRRASRIRRRRWGAAVAGTAVAVAAIGLAVPALSPDRSGDALQRFASPDPSDSRPRPSSAPSVAGDKPGNAVVPVNLLAGWPTRGGHAQDDLIPLLEKAFATGQSRPRDAVRSRVLFSGATTAGLRYVFGQAWFVGEQTAYNVGYTTGGQQGPEPFLGPATRRGAKVLAFMVCCSPSATTETVVVIPAPRITQVLYSASPRARFVPVGPGQSGYDGVVLIDRDPRAQGDRIQLLEGNGGAPTYDGPLMTLLCGLRSCG